MAYAYGMRFDDDSNAITIIDEDNQTAVTTGYINGEPVEFGGNPNSKQIITATADNPCVGIDSRDLREALIDGNASANIYLFNENLGIYARMAIISIGGMLTASVINAEGTNGFYARWTANAINASVDELIMITNGTATDGTAYASMITSELTIIWHPLPEE